MDAQGNVTNAGAMLSARQQTFLTAIVEQYVATGEPVASQTIAAASGLSSATVRNTMAELVDAGYLEQPHTSAGRVPTAKAFRLHVEQLCGGNRIAASLLPVSSRTQINATLQGVSGAEAFLERTSQVLSVLSSGVGVAMSTGREGDLLEHVHFQRLAPKRVLAVVVTHGGAVRDRVLLLDEDVQSNELLRVLPQLHRHQGQQRGAVGVIGTHRLHYEHTINAVQYVAQLFSERQAV